MTAFDIPACTARLEALKTGLQQTIAGMADADRPVELDQTLQGRLSRIDAMSQQQMARASRGRLQTEVSRIDAALARCRKGAYGLCCRCGEAMDASRLDADPAAPFCLDCVAELDEEKRAAGVARPAG